MRTPFGMIGQSMMMGGRGSGRTTRLIIGASRGATLLAADKNHANFLRQRARELDRGDLQVVLPNAHNMLGRGGVGQEVAVDHFAVERWMIEAESVVQEEIRQGQQLLARLRVVEGERDRLKDELAQK